MRRSTKMLQLLFLLFFLLMVLLSPLFLTRLVFVRAKGLKTVHRVALTTVVFVLLCAAAGFWLHEFVQNIEDPPPPGSLPIFHKDINGLSCK